MAVDSTVLPSETQMEPCIFPSLGDARAVSNDNPGYETCMQTLELPDTIQRRSGLPDNVDLDCLLHLAFALLLKAYVRTNDVAFALLPGAAAEGMEKVIEAQLDETATPLENMQKLTKVTRASADTKQFNTALCLTQSHLSTQLMPTSLDIIFALEIIKDDSNNTDSSALRAVLHFRPDHCNKWGAQNVLATFEGILASVAVSLQHPLSEVDMISTRDREQITAWNEVIPSPAHRTLNECLEKVFRENADKEAVHTSEGSFTYRQLDDLSTTLALHLVELGVKPNMVVPLCMDKTRWSTCAMTAVWKAGAALTALEPDHPDERLFSIIADLGAKIVICDGAYTSRFQKLGVQVLSDVEALIATLGRGETTLSPSNVWRMSGVTSTDLAFVVFTSGSTGKPKGILNTHNRVTTEHQWYREGLGYHKDARVLQFASYAYVPGTADNYRTLLHGATLCVPSKVERIADLVGFIQRSKPTRATLTPSVLQTLKPEDIPSVRDLVASGEPVSRDLEAIWSNGRRFVQIYGSTEGGSWIKETTNSVSPTKGSRPATGDQWLIDPNNVNRLVPIGAAGEIVLESYETTSGYLNDPVATSRAFLKSPAWADERNVAAGCKYLRLGDLGRYEDDGSITIYGRADTQIKINGQRVDLQDIESSLRALLPAGSEAAVDLIKPIDAPNRPLLTAFCGGIHVSEDRIGSMLRTLINGMSKTLPQHMVPKVFIMTEQLPRNFSQKIDRKRLRTAAQEMGYKALSQLMLKAAMRDNEEPKSDTERILAQVWAKVLGLDLDTIKRGDDFLALGGDSLSAIRLVPMIRSRGLRLTTLDILTSPILKDMADLAVNSDDDTATIGLHNDTNGSSVSLQATDFQAWAAFAGADNGGWIDHFIYDFVGSLDVDRLQDSCRRLVAAHSVLRTVFVLRKDKIYLQISAQADIKFDVHRTSEDEIESITQELCGRERIRPLGAPIVRFDLIAVSATQHRLIMRLSHAQYDGFCAKNVGQHLRLLYLSQALPTALPTTLPFHEYVNKIQEPEFVQPAEEFWKAHLKGSQMPQLVNRTRSVLPSDKILDGEVRCPIGIPSLKHRGINTAALVKTAWALTVSSLSQSSDVVFGDFVSGRQVPVFGVETVFGPCVNFPPVRVQVKPDLTNFELLKRVQEDLFRSIPHESLGFRHINEQCTNWGQHTRYSSIVNFVGFEPGPGNMRWDTGDGEKQLDVKHIYEEQQHDKTDLWLMCLKKGQAAESASTENSFDLAFRYSKRVYDESAIDQIANIYRDCLLKLATALDAKVLAPYISAKQLARLVPTVTT